MTENEISYIIRGCIFDVYNDFFKFSHMDRGQPSSIISHCPTACTKKCCLFIVNIVVQCQLSIESNKIFL